MQSVWSGTISFGLIHIPIKLYSATVGRQLDFRLLAKKNLCPIKYVRVCRSTGKEVPFDQIVKGYEYKKGDYVILQQQDFKKASRKKSNAIEVVEFVNADEIGDELFDKPYYIEPAKEADRAYVLLREALKKSGKIGIGKFVLRNKEQLVAISPRQNLLMADVLRFKEELRSPKDLKIPGKKEYTKKELDIAVQLIDHMTQDFKHEDFKDTYSEELKKIIKNRAKGKIYQPRVEAPAFEADVADIMKKLKQSLQEAKRKEK